MDEQVPADSWSETEARVRRQFAENCQMCGLTRGAHNGSSEVCPQHEGRMDWPKNHDNITRFVGSGRHDPVAYGVVSIRGAEDATG